MGAGAAYEAHGSAVFQLGQLDGQIEATTRELTVAEEDLGEAQARLEERASTMYKSGNVGFVDVLVGAENFSEFSNRLELWVRLLAQERAEFDRVREIRDTLTEKKTLLETARDQRVAALDEADSQLDQASALEEDAQAYLDGLNAELQAAIEAEQVRQAEEARAAGERLRAEIAEAEPEAVQPVRQPAPQAVQVEDIPVEAIPAGVVIEEPKAERAAAPAPEKTVQAEPVAATVPEAPAVNPQRVASEVEAPQVAPQVEEAAPEVDLAAQQEAQDQAAQAAELAAEQRAAEQAAAESYAAEKAAAAEEARRAAKQATAAQEQYAAKQAAKAERRAELAAQRAAAEKQAAEQAAAAQAEAERLAAKQATQKQKAAAQEQYAADRAAEQQQYAADQAAQKKQAAGQAAAKQYKEKAPETTTGGETTTAAPTGEQYADGGSTATPAQPAAAPAAQPAAAPAAQPAAPASASGSAVVAEATTHMGTPYVFSPPGPCANKVGEDCSCHTMLVFQAFGISLPDDPVAQFGMGTPVSGPPQAGDLVFWAEGGAGITHVGIATGNGTTIHASTYEGVVTETPIDAIPGYAGARRVL